MATLHILHNLTPSCLFVEKTPTTFKQLRDFRNETVTLLHSPSTVLSMSGNDWLNGIIQGTGAGEITGILPHQMLIALDSDKTLRNKRLVRLTSTITKSPELISC